MSNLATNLMRSHEHRWSDIIENPSGNILGHHCFGCKSTEMYPKLADLGEPEEFILVDPKDFVAPRDGMGNLLSDE